MANPPTYEHFIRVLRRVTPPEYHLPKIADTAGTFALYRACARMCETLAVRINAEIQATFYLRHAYQQGEPASSGARATMTATIGRTIDRSDPRLVQAGSMILKGPSGRYYTNQDDVEWIAYDAEPEKSVTFVAPAVGSNFNLDFMADGNGLLTEPQSDPLVPWTSRVDIAPLSGERTGLQGSIVQSVSLDTGSVLVDSGRPDRLTAIDEGLYVKIINSTAPENVGRILRVVGFEAPGVEDPPDSGLIPRRIIVDDGPQRYRLSAAKADDGGVFTDETPAANEESPNDMTLLPAAPAVGDAYYYGAFDRFRSLYVEVSTPGEGTYEIAWEYWDGASWTAIPGVEDGTGGLRQSGLVQFSIPAGWASTTVDGSTALFIRSRVSAFTSITTQPLGSFAYANIQYQLTSDSGGVHWAIFDWRDLGFVIRDMTAPTGGVDATLQILGEERGAFQQAGESDDEFRERAARLADAVSPNAIERLLNRILAEYGFHGRACDVQRGFQGMFLDVAASFAPDVVSALDLYAPGDVFPEDKSMVPISDREERGYFWLKVPRLGLGDWGPFLDEGPILFMELAGSYTTGAADVAFLDGFASVADALYGRIYNAVDAIRAGGVGFTLIIDDNLPKCP